MRHLMSPLDFSVEELDKLLNLVIEQNISEVVVERKIIGIDFVIR